jgi:hypothetical protein
MFPTGLSDIAMLMRFSKISWAWKRKTRRVWRRTSPILLTCIAHFAAFAVAGLFASRVADSADEVLIRASDDCGWYETNQNFETGQISNLTDDQMNFLDSYGVSWRTAASDSRQYAMSCYPWLDGSGLVDDSTVCSSYVVPHISSNISAAECPFAAKACDAPAISLDSGWIDSSIHLGINAQERDRVQVRRKMTCAPIPIEQSYSLPWNSTLLFGDEIIPGDAIKLYAVGQLLNGAFPSYYPVNATFSVDLKLLPVLAANMAM